ncbi:putative carotenoid oxygenase [Helianthus annuus]|nr:putative carotenoid oxygenase [Helianthus annuus]
MKQNGTMEGRGVVVVKPKPNKGLASIVVDWMEKFVVKLMYDSSQPHHWLSHNFAPVHETPPSKHLPVIGHLPECLNGEFVRVGPNPKFPPVAGYHCMIHGLRIKDGKPSYLSRYVRTSRLTQEEFFGGSKFTKIGNLKGPFGFLMILIEMIRSKLKILDLSYGIGTGNTALIYHHGKLLALFEGDKPCTHNMLENMNVIKVLEDGDLQTLGLMDYDERLSHNFTAHPKIDPVTGKFDPLIALLENLKLLTPVFVGNALQNRLSHAFVRNT